jgi:hypothetical protein
MRIFDLVLRRFGTAMWSSFSSTRGTSRAAGCRLSLFQLGAHLVERCPARIARVLGAIACAVVQLPAASSAEALAVLPTQRVQRERQGDLVSEHRLEIDLFSRNPVHVFLFFEMSGSREQLAHLHLQPRTELLETPRAPARDVSVQRPGYEDAFDDALET